MTVIILSVIFSWNNFILPLLVLTDPNHWTLPLGVAPTTRREHSADTAGDPRLHDALDDPGARCSSCSRSGASSAASPAPSRADARPRGVRRTRSCRGCTPTRASAGSVATSTSPAAASSTSPASRSSTAATWSRWRPIGHALTRRSQLDLTRRPELGRHLRADAAPPRRDVLPRHHARRARQLRRHRPTTRAGRGRIRSGSTRTASTRRSRSSTGASTTRATAGRRPRPPVRLPGRAGAGGRRPRGSRASRA